MNNWPREPSALAEPPRLITRHKHKPAPQRPDITLWMLCYWATIVLFSAITYYCLTTMG